MSKIICFKILQLFEALSEKIFHDHTGFIDKANFYSIFPSTTYHWIEMIAVPLGIIAMVFGFLYYIPNAKKQVKNMVLHGLKLILIGSSHIQYPHLHRWPR